jgi:hypothetical protein
MLFLELQSTKLLSKRKREKLEIDGFVYIFEKNNAIDTIKFWRCERKNECRGRIHTDPDNNFLKMITEHTHDTTMRNIKKAIKELKGLDDQLEGEVDVSSIENMDDMKRVIYFLNYVF